MIGCLVIHGFTGSPYEVEPLANYLKEKTNWQVEVPTLPGHGPQLNLEDVTYKEWIKGAEEALKRLRDTVDEIYIIGFSMGGMIAGYLASKYNVEKLVLLAASRKYLSFKQIAIDIGMAVGDRVKGTLHENKMYLHYKNKLGTVPMKANIEFMRLVRYTKPYLKKVDSPVLIAQGHQDGMVPYKTIYHLDKEINSDRKQVVLFDQSKHQLCLGEDKDRINNMVLQFLTNSNE